MGIITIPHINDGINVKFDSAIISEGSVADCVGFDVTSGGRLDTAGGIAISDLTDYLPTGVVIRCVQVHYIDNEIYVIATTDGGVYVNGTLKTTTFHGRFRSLSFMSNIYMVNGETAKRFDKTNVYKWGITPPTSNPTFTAGTHLYKTIETCESVASWTANQVSCTVATEGTIKKQGSNSMKITVVASTVGYSYKTYTYDLTTFSSGAASSDKDYIYCWMLVDNLSNLDTLSFIFDGSDGSFASHTFSYSIVAPTTDGVSQIMSLGQTADVQSEEVVTYPISTDVVYDPNSNPWAGIQNTGDPAYAGPVASVGTEKTITRTITRTVVDPIVSDQVLSFWRRNTLFQLSSGTWQELRIPKAMFTVKGSPSWATIKGLKIIATTTANGTANIYIDDIKMIGGSELIGDYWFMYTWSRNDSSNNIIHESPPAVNSTTKQFVISGPVTFDRHPLAYASRPLSTDTQVTGGNIYALGGNLGDFWLIGSITDNTTTSGTIYGCEPQRILNSQYNFPAPGGSDLALFKNKIWIVGDKNYPQVLRTSDILRDGTLAPEGFPPRNGYELDGNSGELYNIDVLNGSLSIKGQFGEWKVDTNDPTDFLQVVSKRVSDNGLLSQDGIVKLPDSHIYPSKRGFVSTNGSAAQFVFPELEPLIDSSISNSIGVNAGLVSYFTYYTAAYGTRTAKIDLYNGKPRFTNINDILFESLYYDPVRDKVYGTFNGNFCIIDSGSDNAFGASGLHAYLKSRTYRPGGKVVWSWVSFRYNTGGIWYLLHVWVDSKLVKSFPFKSTSIAEGNFRFGPVSGYDFYFEITTEYNTPGQIIFPIRINHSGK